MKKALKTLLILSFTPYVFCLFYGIFSAFNFNGLDEFFYGIAVMALWLCYYPVIPFCLAYQLICLVIFIIKKHILKNLISKLLGIFYL